MCAKKWTHERSRRVGKKGLLRAFLRRRERAVLLLGLCMGLRAPHLKLLLNAGTREVHVGKSTWCIQNSKVVLVTE